MPLIAFIAGVLLGLTMPLARGQAPDETDAQLERQRAAVAAAREAINRPLDSAPAEEAAPPAPDAPQSTSHRASHLSLALGILLLAAAGALYYFFYHRPRPAAGPPAGAAEPGQAASPQRAPIANPTANNPRFLELAVANQLFTEMESTALVERFQSNVYALMLFLVEQRPRAQALIGKLWGDSIGLAYVDPTKTVLQHDILSRLPKGFAEEHNVIPLYAIENVITVAMADPHNTALQRRLESLMDALVSPVFSLPGQIQAALEIAQISVRTLTDQLSSRLAGAAHEGAKIGRLAEEESWSEFARGLFLLAYKQHASDIHIEPHENNVLIRLRIDGALQEYLNLPLRLFPALSNVIKIMAGLDIGERRRPQDGRITLKLPDRALEFRASCVPTIYGEKIVLRLLGQNEFMAVPGLENLSFSKPILDGIRQIIHSPNGVFFVTGPTGSGKTTTLYAALKALNRKDKNIMTIEDPVEYRLPGVNQVQVNPLAGVTFAVALRAFLRQDPDVILVGEIRDLETATIASQAALTGHLVLTTMHTNNALQAVTRLIQIGVEPFLVAPSIIGVMAQRLVRRLCEHCKEKYELSRAEIEEFFIWDGQPVFFHRAKGCERCNFTGFSGRIAIHELFIIDEATRQHIARNASILDIQKYARDAGFTTMRYDGFKKVLMGLTTVDEINQVTVSMDADD